MSTIMDLFSRKIIGWDLNSSLEKKIIINAFKKAKFKRKIKKGLVSHSDRGVQYSSNEFKKNLKNNFMRQSMGRKGNCWDNAPSESFFSTIKSELTNCKIFNCTNRAFSDIFEYIEIFYNNNRLYSKIGYLSPNEFEKRYFNRNRVK